MAFHEFQPEEWTEQLEQGFEYRKKFGLEDIWPRLEAIYYNVHDSMLNDGPNIFLSQGDAMLSMLSVPTPRVSVNPSIPEAVDKAPLLQALDNTLIQDLNITEEVETAALHTYLFGRGIVKIGYDSEWGYDPTLDIGGSLKLGMSLTQVDRTGKRMIEHSGTVPGMPWVQAVMPQDIVLPWGVKDLQRTPWLMHRLVRHIDDLRADPKYENTKNLQPQMSMEDFTNSYRQMPKQTRPMSGTRKQDYVEFFEVHDRRTGKIFAFTWDYPKFLRNDVNANQIDNMLPFAALAFTPRTRAFWTTPDAFYLYHSQNELSDVARTRAKQRRISTLKFLYDKDSISDEELQKILSPDVGVAASIEAGREIEKAILKLDNSPPQGLIQEEELLRANAREQIGFSRNQMGEFTGGRKTAREVDAVDRSSQLRMSKRGLHVKRFYEDIIQIVNGLIFKHWTLPRAVMVLGPSKGRQWMQLNGPGLKSRYSYSVEFVDEKELESQKMQALQLYQLLAQDPAFDPVELRAYLVAKFNDPAFERILNANVRGEMLKRQMQSPDGNTQSGGNDSGRSTAAGLSSMLQQNGQAGESPASGLLASGRFGA